MIGTVTLNMIKMSLQATVKEGKVALLFHFSEEGDPVRSHIVEKIKAIEKVIEGIDVIIAGGTAEIAQEGLDKVIASIDWAIPRAPAAFHEPLYAERAHFVGMKDRFQKLDELLEVECKEDNEKVILN